MVPGLQNAPLERLGNGDRSLFERPEVNRSRFERPKGDRSLFIGPIELNAGIAVVQAQAIREWDSFIRLGKVTLASSFEKRRYEG